MALPDFRVAKTQSGNSAEVRSHTLDSGSAAVTVGQVVGLAADGEVTASGDAPAVAYGVAASNGTPGGTILIYPFTEDIVFSARVVAGAYATDAQQGDLVDLDLTAGVYGLALNESTDDLFEVYGNDTTDSGRVLVIGSAANSQARNSVTRL